MRIRLTDLTLACGMRAAVLLVVTAVPGLAVDWSPKLAAQYLDSREKEWFEWPATKSTGGPCMSCHTGVTYLLARPALRRVLGEAAPTTYETGLVEGLRARAGSGLEDALHKMKEPRASQSVGVEAIFAALFVEPGTPSAQQAFERFWAMQIQEGAGKGAWPWYELNSDPYEMPDSRFFGASLAALAVSRMPAEYQAKSEIQERVAALTEYLRTAIAGQPLHNRLLLLWAAGKLPAAVRDAKQSIIDEAMKKQQADGSWTMASMGPWKERPAAPPAEGGNAYATAVAAFSLEQAGVPRSDPKLKKALEWLSAHQDREFGYWAADSMNKRREPGTIPEGFMRDAATGFAVLALIEPEHSTR